MQDLSNFGYPESYIKDVLHGRFGPRVVRFRYDVLDKKFNKKATLEKVVSCNIEMAAFATIKRTATLELAEEYFPPYSELVNGQKVTYTKTPKINYLQDMIQPFMEIRMPNDEWISFPLGVFYPTTPERKDQLENVYRSIEMYDGLIVLDEDVLPSRLFFSKGTNIINAVKIVLESAGITRYNLTSTSEVLSKDKEWEPGITKLQAINDLLDMITFTPIWTDSNGYYITSPYKPPSERPIDYSYIDNELSVVSTGASEDLDLYNVPNRWVVVKTNPEEAPLVSQFTNAEPSSPTSTIARGRYIVDYREIEEIASQTALDNYVRRIAEEASQIYGKIEFETALMPFHEYHDVVQLKYDPLEIDDVFTETNWSMELRPGGKMTHQMRKVVFLE